MQGYGCGERAVLVVSSAKPRAGQGCPFTVALGLCQHSSASFLCLQKGNRAYQLRGWAWGYGKDSVSLGLGWAQRGQEDGAHCVSVLQSPAELLAVVWDELCAGGFRALVNYCRQ